MIFHRTGDKKDALIQIPIKQENKPHWFRGRWSAPGGFREMLAVAAPLIVSTASWSVQHFVDRMYLAWYSPEAIAASMPAGILNFTIASLFIGSAGYVSVFVAQYHGACRHGDVGPVLWQGMYLSAVAGVVLVALYPLSDSIFAFIGHDPAVARLESIYFKYLCLGGFPLVASSALAGFFSGLGRTWIIMVANVAGTAVNVLFDYILIFGHFGFPEMGMRGAAIATVMSAVVVFVIYAIILARVKNEREFRTRSGWRPDRALMRRLLRYGLPSGVQFFIDVFGFTVFLFFIGKLGVADLAATNIAFNINNLAFMPVIGMGMAVSIKVGHYLGAGDPDTAGYGAWTGFMVAAGYMSFIASLYVLFPGMFIAPFEAGATSAGFGEIAARARVLLVFVAAYSLFDAFNIVFANAIKGAGDTPFVMRAIVVLSAGVLIAPSYLFLFVFRWGIYSAWFAASAYVTILGIVFFARFMGGKWKGMTVMDEKAVIMPPTIECNPASTE